MQLSQNGNRLTANRSSYVFGFMSQNIPQVFLCIRAEKPELRCFFAENGGASSSSSTPSADAQPSPSNDRNKKRREELLKRLQSVEEAIARKRWGLLRHRDNFWNFNNEKNILLFNEEKGYAKFRFLQTPNFGIFCFQILRNLSKFE